MRTGIATDSLDFQRNLTNFTGIKSIPSEPRIPLRNYLLDLVTETDGKESSIYLKGVEKFIQEIWSEIVRNKWRTLHVRKFVPERLKISSIYPYREGKKAISIQNLYKLLILWKEYCKKTEEDLKEKWDEIYASDYVFSLHKGLQPTKLPKDITPKLSYLVGWMCGDGHMVDYGRHYLVNTTEKSIHQLEFVLKPLFEQLFNVRIPLFTYPGKNVLQMGSKPIFRFLTRVLKIKVGEIPQIVKILDPVNTKYFLMGIFDSEGSVDFSYLNARIAIHQANSKFLEEVSNLFKGLGICFTGPYRHENEKGIWFHIQIRRKTDILKFIKEIGSCHIEKFVRLKILEEKLYAHGYSYNST
jgi:hypothetical protein